MSIDPDTVRQAELETARERAESYERRFRNVSCQVSCAQASKKHVEECLDAVEAEAAAANDTLSSTIEYTSLIPLSLSPNHFLILSNASLPLRATSLTLRSVSIKLRMQDVHAKAKSTTDDATDEEVPAGQYHMMDNQGIFTNETRALARNLVQLGVPTANVNEVIHVVAQPMGVTMDGTISDRDCASHCFLKVV